MLDRPIAAFDIETIPDPDVGRRIFGFTGDDQTVVDAMVEKRLKETNGRRKYPQLPHHRIVTICIAWLDPASGRFDVTTVGDSAMDERSHLEGFYRRIANAETKPRLVSWNGNGFDLPVIRYRAMLHGVPMPCLYQTDGEWHRNNYQDRRHDMHVDLMDVLSGYGASHWVGLGTLSELVGLPCDPVLDDDIYAHILRGEEELVGEYCKLDVVLTLLLFLLWNQHRGELAHTRLAELTAGVRGHLERLPHPVGNEIAAQLKGWPQAG